MKIYITGGSCSGKTTLAKELSIKYNVPHFDLDDIKWINDKGKAFVETRNNQERIKIITNIINENDNWIFEGAYFEDWINPILTHVDQVIIIRVPKWIRHYRCLRREFARYNPKKTSLHSVWGLFRWNHNYDRNDLQMMLNKLKQRGTKYRLVNYGSKTFSY